MAFLVAGRQFRIGAVEVHELRLRHQGVSEGVVVNADPVVGLAQLPIAVELVGVVLDRIAIVGLATIRRPVIVLELRLAAFIRRHTLRVLAIRVEAVEGAVPRNVGSLTLILSHDQRGQQRGIAGQAVGVGQHRGRIDHRFLRLGAVVRKQIVVDVDAFGVVVVARVLGGIHQPVIDDHQSQGLVVAELVVEHLDLIGGQDDHAGAARHRRGDGAARREVVDVVVDDFVVVEAVLVAVAGAARQVHGQKAAGVVGGQVVVHFRVVGVLELVALHVPLGHVVAHDHALALAHVEAHVRGAAGDTVLDQHVGGQHRVEGIGAITGPAFLAGVVVGVAFLDIGPGDLDPAHGDEARVGDLEAIAGGVLDGQVLHRQPLSMAGEYAFLGIAVGEVEDGLVDARAAYRDAAGVAQHQASGELEGALAELDHITFAGIEKGFQGVSSGGFAGTDPAELGRGARQGLITG